MAKWRSWLVEELETLWTVAAICVIPTEATHTTNLVYLHLKDNFTYGVQRTVSLWWVFLEHNLRLRKNIPTIYGFLQRNKDKGIPVTGHGGP
jgi:hypothetical protein